MGHSGNHLARLRARGVSNVAHPGKLCGKASTSACEAGWKGTRAACRIPPSCGRFAERVNNPYPGSPVKCMVTPTASGCR